jgi:hypothetical protein
MKFPDADTDISTVTVTGGGGRSSDAATDGTLFEGVPDQFVF